MRKESGRMSRFDWDPAKDRENLRKHGIRFETASHVFEDPWILSRRDMFHADAEDCYNALGEIAPGVVLFVVYTWREKDGEEAIRLISARKALPTRERHMKKLTAVQKRDIAAVATKPEATIDFSDMPEVLDWTGAEVGRFYRPAKRPITIRLDEDIIDWLKGFGRGYQTRANLLLRYAMEASRHNARSQRAAR